MADICDHSDEKREVIVHEHQYENVCTCEACGNVRREYDYRAGGSRVVTKNDVDSAYTPRDVEYTGTYSDPGLDEAYQKYKSKRDAKMNLFLTLMASRKVSPPPYVVVNAMNTIDVIFNRHKSVIDFWHKVYDSHHQKAENINWEQHDHLYVQMLSEMARVLGYKNLQQIDIDKFYTPIAHGEQYLISQKLQQEFLRVLENTSHFVTLGKDWMQKKPDDKNQTTPQK